jgi:hypothetical protein
MDGDDMRRRVVLRGLLGGVGLTLSAPVLEAIDTVRRSLDTTIADDADPGMLDEWERRADDYAQAYLVTPPAVLLADALLDFTDVQNALKQGEYGRQRARLWRLSTQLAGMIGLSLYVLGQHRDARAWYHTGRRAARLCEDTSLQAWMYVRAAGVSLHYGTPSSALELADQAARLHRGPSGATARAHVIRSRALARLNDRTSARHALDQAGVTFEALDGKETSNKAFGYTERQFLAHSANAMTTLRDTSAAQRLRDQAFAGFAAQGSSEPLDPVLAKFDEALSLIWQSDPTQACRHVIDAVAALPSGHRTGLVRVYAFAFANELTPDQQRQPAGVELKESLRSAFSDAPAA